MASLVDHEPADLTLVSLLAETPKNNIVIDLFPVSVKTTGDSKFSKKGFRIRAKRREAVLSLILGWKNKSINKFLS